MDLRALRADLESVFSRHLGDEPMHVGLKSNTTNTYADMEMSGEASSDDVPEAFMDWTTRRHEKAAVHVRELEQYVQERHQRHDQRLTAIEERLSRNDGRKV